MSLHRCSVSLMQVSRSTGWVFSSSLGYHVLAGKLLFCFPKLGGDTQGSNGSYHSYFFFSFHKLQLPDELERRQEP